VPSLDIRARSAESTHPGFPKKLRRFPSHAYVAEEIEYRISAAGQGDCLGSPKVFVLAVDGLPN